MNTIHRPSPPRPGPHRHGIAALTLATAAALAGCGGAGGDTSAGESSSPPSGATAAAHGTRAPGIAAKGGEARMVAPLFDDRGRPRLSPPSAAPADTAARTRQGLYASHGQLEWEELTVGIFAVVLDVDAEGGVDAAVHRARSLLTWYGNDGTARVYDVRARDPSAAALVVDTLSDDGFGWVYTVH